MEPTEKTMQTIRKYYKQVEPLAKTLHNDTASIVLMAYSLFLSMVFAVTAALLVYIGGAENIAVANFSGGAAFANFIVFAIFYGQNIFAKAKLKLLCKRCKAETGHSPFDFFPGL